MTEQFATPQTPEERVLQERAERYLLQPEFAAAEVAHGTEHLICRLQQEHYALAVSALRAVQSARGLTPLPSTPPFVAGVLNVRGTVVTVLDLAQKLGLGPTTVGPASRVVLTSCPPPEQSLLVGILVDEIMTSQFLDLDTLAPALSADPAIRGIAEAEIVVLDLPAMLADGRFLVDDAL